jgi:hypothetical protein
MKVKKISLLILGLIVILAVGFSASGKLMNLQGRFTPTFNTGAILVCSGEYYYDSTTGLHSDSISFSSLIDKVEKDEANTSSSCNYSFFLSSSSSESGIRNSESVRFRCDSDAIVTAQGDTGIICRDIESEISLSIRETEAVVTFDYPDTLGFSIDGGLITNGVVQVTVY